MYCWSVQCTLYSMVFTVVRGHWVLCVLCVLCILRTQYSGKRSFSHPSILLLSLTAPHLHPIHRIHSVVSANVLREEHIDWRWLKNWWFKEMSNLNIVTYVMYSSLPARSQTVNSQRRQCKVWIRSLPCWQRLPSYVWLLQLLNQSAT